MQVTRGILDKKTGRGRRARKSTPCDTRRVQPPRHDAGGAACAEAVLRSEERSGHRDRRQLVAAFRRRFGRAADVARSGPRRWASSRRCVFRGFAVAGCEPDEMGIGPVFAVPKLLKRHGLKVDDIDLWELNEAFAVQVVYCRDRLGHRPDEAQRQRRLDRDRPSVRHDRLAAGRHDRQRDAAPQGPLRRRDDVHRRRPGRGGAVRVDGVTLLRAARASRPLL